MNDPGFINVSKQGDLPLVYRGPEDLPRHLVQMNEEVEVLIKSLGLQQ